MKLFVVWLGVFGIILWARGTRFASSGVGATRVISGTTCGDMGIALSSRGATCGSFKLINSFMWSRKLLGTLEYVGCWSRKITSFSSMTFLTKKCYMCMLII